MDPVFFAASIAQMQNVMLEAVACGFASFLLLLVAK